MEELYPLTIIMDRYNGVYSGGKYTAWNCQPHFIPSGIYGDDMDCYDTWDEVRADVHMKYMFGVGDTIEDAIKNLANKRREIAAASRVYPPPIGLKI